MKRFFFCIALLFLFCTLFFTKIIGTITRTVLKHKYDCELAYRSLNWEEGALVFSDLVLFDPAFHTHMEKASFRLDWSFFPNKFKGHITVDSPHFSIIKKRDFPKFEGDWFDFSLSVNNGTLDWGGRVQFSLNCDSLRKLQASFDWEDGCALVDLNEGRVDAELKNFKISLLKPWIPIGEISDGALTGRLSMDVEGRPLSAHLKMAHVAMDLPLGAIEGLEGAFSYNADIGAKWDLNGIGESRGKQFFFSSQGRGFFKSRWFDAEVRFDESWCKVKSGEIYELECYELFAEEATWLQAGISAFWPEFGAWEFTNGKVTGKANISQTFWNAELEAKNLELQKGEYSFFCERAAANFTNEGGSFIIQAKDYDLKFAGMWEDWNAEARIGPIHLALSGGWDGRKLQAEIERGTCADLQFKGKGWIDPNLDAFFTVDGNWNFLQKQIPFRCPILSKQGKFWVFDFRLERKTWDLFRLAGTYDGKEISYHPMSHLLGEPLLFTRSPIGEIDISLQLPWKALLSAGPFLKEWGVDLKKIPALEKSDLHFQYKQRQIDVTAKGNNPPFFFHAVQTLDEWEIDLQSDLTVRTTLKKDGSLKGYGKWKTDFETEFEGKITPSLHCEISLSKASLDLKTIHSLNMEGRAEGGGHLIYNGQIESDLDFTVSSLNIYSYPFENEGQIHLYYSSNQGVLLRGVNLHGPFTCIIDLLEYDTHRSHWIFRNAQIHLPGPFLTHQFLQILDKERDLNFTATLDFAADFSSLVCTMREGSIPYNGAYRHIENLELSWKNSNGNAAIQDPENRGGFQGPRGKCKAALHYLDHLYRIDLQIGEKIEGRLILGEEETPLTIDWEYGDVFSIHSIEGSFSGIDAAFHAESPNILMGSAHFNFTALSPLLPPDVAKVFDEIKMGQGYDLKGRLKIERNRPYFQGILSGKAIELFGFQFRTLLAQTDLGPEKMRIYDVKISDSAGVMKIDEILLEGKDGQPWTIAIPNLAILDLRPSLLQRPGGVAGPLDPLVVRELKITGFKGLLDDGKTYTATGRLHFINSYKRGETVFDLPVNVLSRIVGLDLELLVPVTGDLTFDIKDGYFNLLELSNAYSEGERSQFFLITDPPPRMDLDGNLQIFIKMKQFVLLKITESLLISVDGILDDPQFHLKKRRLFGLM